MTRIAIVGSRQRTDRHVVDALVATFPPETIIVSGGAVGPDTWAEEAAKAHGLQTHVFLPDLKGSKSRIDVTMRYYARNQQIVDSVDVVYALVAPDGKGATEDTIRRAKKRGIPINLL